MSTRRSARIGDKYLFVYNIKVEDVKRSLCAGVSKPADGPEKRPTGSEGFRADGYFWLQGKS
jgi:hypothetical protein